MVQSDIKMTVSCRIASFDTKLCMLYTLDCYFNRNYFGNKTR